MLRGAHNLLHRPVTETLARLLRLTTNHEAHIKELEEVNAAQAALLDKFRGDYEATLAAQYDTVAIEHRRQDAIREEMQQLLRVATRREEETSRVHDIDMLRLRHDAVSLNARLRSVTKERDELVADKAVSHAIIVQLGLQLATHATSSDATSTNM